MTRQDTSLKGTEKESDRSRHSFDFFSIFPFGNPLYMLLCEAIIATVEFVG